MGYRLAYCRISTAAQNPLLQLDAVHAAGVDEVYVDHASGVATSRPKLDELLRQARPGDTIVVWRLARLGRSMKHLLELIEQLKARNIALVSLNEQIDTTSANGGGLQRSRRPPQAAPPRAEASQKPRSRVHVEKP